MIFDKVEQEHVLEAIKDFEKKGLPRGFGPSTTYNLVHERKTYPPKAIMAYARQHATGETIKNDFGGGEESRCFNALIKLGFTILEKDVISELINNFIEQAKTSDLKTKHYPKNFEDLKIKVSFGAGNTAQIPWISFLKEPNTTSKGVYPVYLYFKKYNLLILAFGRSETNLPGSEWNISTEETIKDFFIRRFNSKPARYGDSHVFKVYDVNNLPNSKILKDDLLEIIKKYKVLSNNNLKSNKTKTHSSFDIKSFITNTYDSGLIFSDQLIKRFVASIWTKPFVICSGLSGSGKTKLAQAFAMWICQDKSQYEIVPVGADWTNREPLLGYPNALDEQSYVKPENGILQLILNAKANENLPYFLILDEMNLSHVERYFADFLSTMESKEAIPLHKIDNEKSGTIPQKLALPSNLFIIGTVNIDETTYMFSPKVLDRANTIEFRLSEDDLEKFMASDIPLDLGKLEHQGATMAEDFVRIAQSKTISSLSKYKDDIVKFFGELQKSGAEFGYRTTSEIGQLISHLDSLGEVNDNLLDIAIMQKLLPKLHGSRTKLTKTLVTLGGFCLVDNKDIKENYFNPYLDNSKDLNDDNNVKYKLSFEKICRMYKNAVENGFASYAEA